MNPRAQLPLLGLLPLAAAAFLVSAWLAGAVGITADEAAALLPTARHPSPAHGFPWLAGGLPVGRWLFAAGISPETLRYVSGACLVVALGGLVAGLLRPNGLLHHLLADHPRLPGAAAVVLAALLATQPFVLLVHGLAFTSAALGGALLSLGVGLLPAPDAPARCRVPAYLLLLAAGLLLPPLLFAFAASRLAHTPAGRPSGPLRLLAAAALAAVGPLAVLVLWRLATDSTHAFAGVPATVQRLADLLRHLLAAWGQPVRFLAAFFRADTRYLNPITLLFGAFVMLHAPVLLVLRRAGPHRAAMRTLTLALVAAAGVAMATSGTAPLHAASAVYYPLLALSAVVWLLHALPVRWRRFPLRSLVIPMLVLGFSVATLFAVRLVRERPPAMRLDVQRWLATSLLPPDEPARSHPAECLVHAGQTSLGALGILTGGRLQPRHLPLPLPTGRTPPLPWEPASCDFAALILEVHSREPQDDAGPYCRRQLQRTRLGEAAQHAGYGDEDALAVGKGGVPGFCLFRFAREATSRPPR